MTNNVLIKAVSFDSQEYYQAREIREKYLRLPLRIIFTDEDLEIDRYSYHFVAYNEQNMIVGCVLGIRENHQVKIRQMLVIPEYQKKGIGSLLLNKIEEFFYNLGINHFYLHGRKESIIFYQKNGYIFAGNSFIEVGIPHQRGDKFY
ncbi:GNAT family N-acetyltransferase [Geminocystis sp.]|uniref:GNAT family N-acetyltransferase n=1 Tax=Geminocystis sp. TaxID=2664100 RepID=UPI003593FD0D